MVLLLILGDYNFLFMPLSHAFRAVCPSHDIIPGQPIICNS